MRAVLRRLAELALRVPLLHKILIANSLIITLGAIGGTVITVRHVLDYPGDFHYELIVPFGLVGLTASVLINYAALRLALRPLGRLQTTVDRALAGDAAARVPAGHLDDPQLARLTTAFNQMMDAQADSEAELRRLSGRILSAQEEERQRVARELHDESAQALTMMLIRLRMLERAGDPEQVRASLAELRALTAQSLDEIRRIAVELRPKILEDIGLGEALAWRVDELNKSGAVKASLARTGPEQRLPREVELVLYRVAQEALTNIARHAGARTASVVLERRPHEVTLVVVDDGKGFEPARAWAKPTGFGLAGMRERLALVGGDLKLESASGRGTRVCAVVPLA